MKIKTADLTGKPLDYAVGLCEGHKTTLSKTGFLIYSDPFIQIGARGRAYRPSSDWEQGGPIIEREEIDIYCHESLWWVAEGWFSDGERSDFYSKRGRSPLIAAMRCYVASKLGDEVEIPDELT